MAIIICKYNIFTICFIIFTIIGKIFILFYNMILYMSYIIQGNTRENVLLYYNKSLKTLNNYDT